MNAPSLPLTFGGRGALVTGAASGIGAATAHLLVRAGIRTLALDLKVPDPADGDNDLLIECAADVRDSHGLYDVVRHTFPDGNLNYVVNCAGVPAHTGFRGVGVDAWRTVLDVNLIGAYNVIDVTANLLGSSKTAAVVNITSIEAARVIALTNPDPNPHYAASKAALAMLTRTAARALGPHTRVNSIAPGFVATPMASEHGDISTLPAQLAGRTVLRRWAHPEEIASAAAFLLSDQASFITGAELVVDGGFAIT
ncbi:SDR family NAD(P)-dependent oxidoreductase [Mycolicibacterium goodii]|uniref:SDR family NAD(P)-dependent oxidoreductase n=1 Tax=Mycolicibacterium goodii TaxID=134601 RepID=UPI000C25DAB9|nr:SDR family oxidoreductase [Mycolicibacterium goodii]PJK18425.1 3-oxoacyl-ACP reductase [Mycolicibacterium goodii]